MYPDLLCCFHGRFLGIEVKKEDGVISDIQQWNINEIRKAKGYAICTKPSDFDEIKRILTIGTDLSELEMVCRHNEKSLGGE